MASGNKPTNTECWVMAYLVNAGEAFFKGVGGYAFPNGIAWGGASDLVIGWTMSKFEGKCCIVK